MLQNNPVTILKNKWRGMLVQVLIDVSLGELIDKLTILQIKAGSMQIRVGEFCHFLGRNAVSIFNSKYSSSRYPYACF